MKQDNDFIHELPEMEQRVLQEHTPLTPQMIFKL